MYVAQRTLAYKIARRRGLSREASEDLASECVLRLLSLCRVTKDVDRLTSRIAGNLAADHYRNRRTSEETSSELDGVCVTASVGITLNAGDWTDSELSILRFMAAGMNDREITAALRLTKPAGAKVIAAVRAKGRELIELAS